jgi:hypothetical protein
MMRRLRERGHGYAFRASRRPKGPFGHAIPSGCRASRFRHPGLAQTLDHSVPIFEQARVAVRIGGLSNVRLPRSDRPLSGRRERKETLERFTGLRVVAAQSERRNKVSMCKRKVRTDRKRLPGRIYRLIVLLQREIKPRSKLEPTKQKGICGLSRIALSKYSRAFSNCPSSA